MAAKVVPRVLPTFVHEVRTSATPLILAHLDAFAQNIDRIFASRVEQQDVVLLLECLFDLTHHPHNEKNLDEGSASSPVVDKALRILHLLFREESPYSVQNFRGIKTLSTTAITAAALARQPQSRPTTVDAAASSVVEFPDQVSRPGTAADESPHSRRRREPKDDEGLGETEKPSTGTDEPTAEETNRETTQQPTTEEGDQPAPQNDDSQPKDDAPETNEEKEKPTEDLKEEQPASKPSTVQQPTSYVQRYPPRQLSPETEKTIQRLRMDSLLLDPVRKASVISLWRKWDSAGVDISAFTASPETLHAIVPSRSTQSARVFRDFITCTQRPKITKRWGSVCCVHLKTNIKAKSDVMYRFLIEGYNYGVNAVVHSDVVGCTHRSWDQIGEMTKYGWPEGWDAEMTNDYAAGAAVSQYYSKDGFLTVRLKAKSFFCVGFSVSAWLVFHGYGAGFEISAEIFHQDDDI